MQKYDFEQSIGYWIATTHQAYMRAFQERLVPHDITYRQAQVLAWLTAEGPQTQGELANHMLIEPPTLVGVLDRMADAGLLERRACEDDRRRKRVHVLPAGNKLWEEVADCAREMREHASEGLSEREATTLRRLLKKVRENVSSLEPVGP